MTVRQSVQLVVILLLVFLVMVAWTVTTGDHRPVARPVPGRCETLMSGSAVRGEVTEGFCGYGYHTQAHRLYLALILRSTE